ncbi:MAG: ATPase [Bacteroidetes bacterium]|nr:ATPase [Bacteroidota bacterium]
MSKLKNYKKKYYLNKLLKGIIFSTGLLLSAYILVNFLEYGVEFNKYSRAVLFFSFVILILITLAKWIIIPVTKLLTLYKVLSDEEAARQIGRFFPEIKDKLLNTLQLYSLSHKDNGLVIASIEQKSKEIVFFKFSKAVNLKEDKKRLKYIFIPVLIIFIVLLFNRQIFTKSTARIIHYNKDYLPKAPFQFIISNNELTAFKNEDFEIKLNIGGNYVPENVYLISQGRKQKMIPNGPGWTKKKSKGAKMRQLDKFSFTFKKIQSPVKFFFEAAGYRSGSYNIKLISRPHLKSIISSIAYPKYLHKKNEKLYDMGNLTVPQGSIIKWQFKTIDTDSLYLKFSSPNLQEDLNINTKKVNVDLPAVAQKAQAGIFEHAKKLMLSENYQVILKNKYSRNKEKISYFINVIPDQYPKVTLEQAIDTILFNYLILGGSISDDYGFTQLRLFYTKSDLKSNSLSDLQSIPLKFNKNSANQNYFFQWELDSLNLKAGEKLQYFVKVWDNDGVTGHKSSKTITYEFKLPTDEEIEKEIEKSSKETGNQLDKALKEAQQIQKELEKLQARLKSKKNLDWQDKKLIEELLNKHNALKKEIEKLQLLNSSTNRKKERFQQQNERIAQKAEQLQKLMDELLDEETRKLYEELQKLLQEKTSNEDWLDMLDKLSKKDINLERELERAIEMFKQLKFEQDLEKAINELKELAEEQDALSKKSLDKDKKDSEELLQEQEKLNEQFKDIRKSLEELSELNKSREFPDAMEDTDPQEESIQNEQQKSSESLQNKQNKKAGKSQKNASQKMEELADKLSLMMQSMEMTSLEENMDDLRDILENLITLSFEQEDLMKEFRNVHQTDPRFIKLSQHQLKLKDDAKIIEDSLLALAKRVFQIQSFVTREVTEMKEYMDASLDAIKKRKIGQTAGKQQYAMTSINNLALLLNDVLKQMQQQMADAMPGNQTCSKPGKKPKRGKGKLSMLQQQLNQKIEALKKSGKTGKQLSEELAKLAAEQEMLRNALKELEGKEKPGGEKDGGNLGNIAKKMEETETDLVNKRITEETIRRQREILTRLLESEKAMREREWDEERESEKAKQKERKIPPAFEDYIKTKEKQIELLKTISPNLNPYYKKEVHEYFQKI